MPARAWLAMSGRSWMYWMVQSNANTLLATTMPMKTEYASIIASSFPASIRDSSPAGPLSASSSDGASPGSAPGATGEPGREPTPPSRRTMRVPLLSSTSVSASGRSSSAIRALCWLEERPVEEATSACRALSRRLRSCWRNVLSPSSMLLPLLLLRLLLRLLLGVLLGVLVLALGLPAGPAAAAAGSIVRWAAADTGGRSPALPAACTPVSLEDARLLCADESGCPASSLRCGAAARQRVLGALCCDLGATALPRGMPRVLCGICTGAALQKHAGGSVPRKMRGATLTVPASGSALAAPKRACDAVGGIFDCGIDCPTARPASRDSAGLAA